MASPTDNLTDRLTVLAEPMRLQILMVIRQAGSCCASEILGHFDITQPTLSHHMSVLIDNGLVKAVKQGRFMRYSINKAAVLELKKVLELIASDAPSEKTLDKTSEKSSDKPAKRSDKKKDKEKKKKKDKKKKK